LLQDLRFAARMLVKSPGYTLVAVLALALGISANTAIFSVVIAILLRPLPYKESDRIVVPVSTNTARGFDRASVSYADYLDWKKETEIFESVAALSPQWVDLSGEGEPERVQALRVSEDYFAVMASPPVLGRTFSVDDYREGAEPVVVLSYGLWQRRFGGDQGVLGQKLLLNGRPYPVIGVMAKDSQWPDDVEIWVPLAVGANPSPDLLRRDNLVFNAVARLKPGVSVERANAAMHTIALRLEQEFPESRKGWSNRALPLRDYIVDDQLHLALVVLLAAVGFVLLIACVNVANLLLARAATREREMAIRMALGSGRARLIRQMLTESLLLALAGGGAGLMLALWGIDLLTTLAPRDIALIGQASLDGRVLAFTLAVSLATAIAFGLLPALQASNLNLTEALKEGSRGATGSRRARRTRSALVITEVMLSVVLLVGAGLLVRSFLRLQEVDSGFKVDNLVTMSINAASARYPERPAVKAFYENLVDRVKAMPGVESAAISSAIPLGGGGFYLGRVFLIEGHPEPPGGPDHQAQWNVTGPSYFNTMGMTLIEGRDFDDRDRADSNKVIVINQTLARQMFPDQSPLGKRIRSWRDENELREIVGVVQDIRYYGQDDELRGLVYVPHAQDSWRSMVLSVRTTADPSGMINALREQIWSVDKNLAIAQVKTMRDVLNESMAPRRFSMLMLVGFAATAMLLAAVGLYGVLSYNIAQRRQEIGLRMALGAGRGDVVRLVVAYGAKLLLVGLALGLAAAFALARLMGSLLYEVSASDPITFAAISLVLVAVGLAAILVPALRATRVDPIVALRYE
ncbi:MAG TPA: ABC transporter permease, partial [Blastocatellia bacterium]